MRQYLLTFLVLLVFSSSAFAGYDKTEWGMSLDKVKKLYPGGYATKTPAGETVYSVIKRVGAIEEAIVGFFFNKLKLDRVSISIPKAASKVDLKNDSFVYPSAIEGKAIFESLLAGLKMKYGEPTVVDDTRVLWDLKDGDRAGLFNNPVEGQPTLSEPSLMYMKINQERFTDGL